MSFSGDLGATLAGVCRGGLLGDLIVALIGDFSCLVVFGDGMEDWVLSIAGLLLFLGLGRHFGHLVVGL